MTDDAASKSASDQRLGAAAMPVWPPEYSPETLRAHSPDLQSFTDEELWTHYVTYGRDEGRIAAEAGLRENLVSMIDPNAWLLEVGPFCQPVFSGPNVRYMDVLDADSLRRRAVEIGIDPTACPDEIHFLGDLSPAAGSEFDVVFSSHNIEHQPNLVRHLQDVERCLGPEGVFVLLVPDKRYCFDHFLPETTLPEVLEAQLENRTRHSPRHVIEHIALTCHNDISRHWRGDHGPAPDTSASRVMEARRHIEISGDLYVDVHAWKFTPSVFRSLMSDLFVHGLTRLKPERVYETPINRCEFAAVLRLQDQQN